MKKLFICFSFVMCGLLFFACTEETIGPAPYSPPALDRYQLSASRDSVYMRSNEYPWVDLIAFQIDGKDVTDGISTTLDLSAFNTTNGANLPVVSSSNPKPATPVYPYELLKAKWLTFVQTKKDRALLLKVDANTGAPRTAYIIVRTKQGYFYSFYVDQQGASR